MIASYGPLLTDYARGHESATSSIALIAALAECRQGARLAARRALRMGNPPKRVRVALDVAKGSHAPLLRRSIQACRESGIDFRAAYREVYARTSFQIARRALDRIQPQRQAVPA